jgi:hypothetical protein
MSYCTWNVADTASTDSTGCYQIDWNATANTCDGIWIGQGSNAIHFNNVRIVTENKLASYAMVAVVKVG